jgi:hypothetical protein
MADTLKRIYFGQPGTTNATIYTAPTTPSGSGASAVIRTVHICNTTTNPATISLSVNGSAATAANNVYRAFTIPASGIHVANVSLVLESGDTLQALQGTASALTMLISGVEF